MKIFKKLRNRFIWLNMITISIMMLMAFVVMYVMIYTNIQKQNDIKLQNISASMRLGQASLSDNTLARQSMSAAMLRDYTLSFNLIVTEDDQLVSIHSYVEMSEETYWNAKQLALNQGKQQATISLDGKLWMYQIKPLDHILLNTIEGTLQLGNGRQISFLDVTDSHQILMQLLITFWVIACLMLVVIFGISVLFAKRAVAPVQRSYMKQKQFITDASHELKTPIASISANVEALMMNREQTIQSQQKWLHYIKTEADRMGKLVGDLLYLAKTDHAEAAMQQAPFDLSDTIRDAVLSMEAIAYEKGLTVTQQIEPSIIVNGDSDKIQQVVKILFDNAIKYTDQGGSIAIALNQVRHQVIFEIQNTGQGISKQHLERLFDRFYRIDESRAHDGSCGLGLSIAKAIVDRMGGKIDVSSEEGKSITFTVIFHNRL